MIYFAVGKWNLCGGSVITVSHNPGNENGIKFYPDQVVAVGLDAGQADIRDAFLANRFEPAADQSGARTPKNITLIAKLLLAYKILGGQLYECNLGFHKVCR